MVSNRRQIDPALNSSRPWREIMAFYRYLKPGLWLMKLPLIGAILQKAAIKEGQDANWFIPVGETIQINEEIPRGRQQILPGVVVERLLQAADGIFAMAACPCRTAFKCQAHSWDVGCLHLGPASYGIPPELGRQLSPEQGREHLRRALAEGLTPTILYIPSEAEIFRVDKARMLSICFCCECCCDVRLMLRKGPDRYWDTYNKRLPGLRMVVSDACTGCGECVDACYGGERVIRMGREKAEIHDRCLGCGRCISACPRGAISIEIEPGSDVLQALVERISERVRIS
ncbi:MAG: 4Fe-4S binding protein [Anaerolineales bacterium]|nr:4Fe-4S binding protein [Anaerolineales bacterium]